MSIEISASEPQTAPKLTPDVLVLGTARSMTN